MFFCWNWYMSYLLYTCIWQTFWKVWTYVWFGCKVFLKYVDHFTFFAKFTILPVHHESLMAHPFKDHPKSDSQNRYFFIFLSSQCQWFEWDYYTTRFVKSDQVYCCSISFPYAPYHLIRKLNRLNCTSVLPYSKDTFTRGSGITGIPGLTHLNLVCSLGPCGVLFVLYL